MGGKRSLRHRGQKDRFPAMWRALRTLFYVAVGVLFFAAFQILILPPEHLAGWWLPVVICLGCVGAAFTITQSMRDDR